MKKYFLLVPFIIILLLATSCNKETATTFYGSGMLKSEIELKDNVVDGTGRFYSKDGMLKMEMAFKNNVPLRSKSYDKAGKLFSEYNYLTKETKEYTNFGQWYIKGLANGKKKNGLWKQYSADGDKLLSEFTFKEDIKSGPCKLFWESGLTYQVGFYKYGVQDSVWVAFEEDGSYIWIEVYKADPKGKFTSIVQPTKHNPKNRSKH